MKVTCEPKERSITQHYELTDREMEILYFIQEHGWIDFSRIKYGDHHQAEEDDSFHYNEFADLLLHRFIYEDKEKWCAYVLSPLGEMFTSKSPN